MENDHPVRKLFFYYVCKILEVKVIINFSIVFTTKAKKLKCFIANSLVIYLAMTAREEKWDYYIFTELVFVDVAITAISQLFKTKWKWFLKSSPET